MYNSAYTYERCSKYSFPHVFISLKTLMPPINFQLTPQFTSYNWNSIEDNILSISTSMRVHFCSRSNHPKLRSLFFFLFKRFARYIRISFGPVDYAQLLPDTVTTITPSLFTFIIYLGNTITLHLSYLLYAILFHLPLLHPRSISLSNTPSFI